MAILTVGDGDFSFSLSLANQLLSNDTAKLTATSHESLKSVLDTYKPHSQATLASLRSLGATVLHEVDATNLAATTELHSERESKHGKKDKDEIKVKLKKFDVVIWNFPCLSLPAGADGQAKELAANRELLTSFFNNVHQFLRKGTGEVHISHKTVEPFSWWGIKQLAAESGFDFAYAVIFDRCL
jgi:25S rRNA (uracil2634-N3)-methyltransferase